MILLIDANYLCHRAYYSTPHMFKDGKRVETLFGVLREVSYLIQRYQPESVLWCFDSQHSLRKQVYPAYKANRGASASKKRILWRQIKRMRKRQLKMFGFRNIYMEAGYEADDLIAHLIDQIHFAQPIVIVSADADLKQCLAENIKIYNPQRKQEYTLQDFVDNWQTLPCTWPLVKAIAGDTSDNIEGVPGVGEKTAAKWVCGKLPVKSAKWEKISENLSIQNTNLPLVRLPYEGLQNREFKIQPDHITRGQWRNAIKKIGLDPITYPGAQYAS